MLKKILLVSLFLVSIGAVFAFTHVNSSVPGGSSVTLPLPGLGTAPGTTSPIFTPLTQVVIPTNLTPTHYGNELDSAGYADAKECIDNAGKYELKCSDGSTGTYSDCLDKGEYTDASGVLNSNILPTTQQSVEYYCYAEELVGQFPLGQDYSILANQAYRQNLIVKSESFLNDCDLEYSLERIEMLDSATLPMGQTISITESDLFSDEGMCMIYLTDANSNTNKQFYITEHFFDTQLNYPMQPFIEWQREINGESYKKFNDLTYEEKCNYLEFQQEKIDHQSAFTVTNYNNIQGNKQTFDVYVNYPTLYYWPSTYISNGIRNPWITGIIFEEFEPANYEKHELTFETINSMESKCYENPIDIKLKTYLRDYPDLTFEDGVWPKGATLIFNFSESAPENLIFDSKLTDGAMEDLLSTTGTSTGWFQFSYNSPTWSNSFPEWSKNYVLNYTTEDIFYTDIQTSLSGNSVTPGNPFTFVLSAFTFDGVDIASFKFDPGQREAGNGELIDVAGEFQCKESSTVQCLIDDAVYDGVPRIGNACGCPADLNGAGTVYLGEKEGTKDDDAYKRKFDGTEFEYSFSMEYPSKTSCGPDRICQVELEVTDVNGRTSEKLIELNLPGVQTCGGVYENSKLGNNSTQFVGYINDGEQSCECKFGYSPELDNTLSLALGSPTNVCVLDVLETTNETESEDKGKSNPTYHRNQNRDYSEYSSSNPFDTEEKEPSSAITWFLVLLLVVLAGLFGFEFYRKKKTGSYFNPFKKSPTSASGPSGPISQSPIQKFISDAKNVGEDMPTIKRHLKESGWPENEINKYI